jgi:8-oxo-dGTP diphosphatase
MSKVTKYVVSVILKKGTAGDFLVVKRPDNDPDLGGHWGFPSVTLKENEFPEEGAHRVCVEKLGCRCKPTRFLGLMFQKRNSYDIFLMDIEAELVKGSKPDVTKAPSEATVYVGQKWSTDPMDLMPAAEKGSCCASIFLTDRGLLNKNKWIKSLEGSETVG